MNRKQCLLILSKKQYASFTISGKTFKYNQIVANGNFESVSNWQYSNCSYVVANNVATITPTAIHSYFRQSISGTNGHKYYYCFDIKYASGESYYINILNIQTSNTGTGQWEHKEGIISVSNTNNFFNIYDYDNNLRSEWQLKNVMVIDLTALGLDSITTTEQFFATELGQVVNNGFYLPTNSNNVIYNAETPFNFVYRTFTPRTNFQLRGIINEKDLYDTKSGAITRKVGVVDLGTLNWNYNNGLFWTRISDRKSGNMNINIAKYRVVNTYSNMPNNSIIGGYLYYADNIIINDTNYDNASDFKNAMSGVYLYYQLANTTTEQVEGVALNDDTNKCYDKNGLELEIVW